MNRTVRASARLGAAVLVAIALSVAAAVPATSHTGFLFTVSEIANPLRQIGTINASTALISPLESTASGLFTGIEIVGETGYASYAANNDTAPFAIATWDHTTGALISSVPVVLDVPGDVLNLQGLDSLPDGTLLAYVWADIQHGEFWETEYWVASIDPGTGMATLLVEITDLATGNLYTDSLATDPTTGATPVGDPPESRGRNLQRSRAPVRTRRRVGRWLCRGRRLRYGGHAVVLLQRHRGTAHPRERLR